MSIIPSSHKKQLHLCLHAVTTFSSTLSVLLPQRNHICRAIASVLPTQTVAPHFLFFSSDIHHLNGDRDPAQRRRAAAGQPSDLPSDQPVLLPPLGPQAQEDVSRPRRLRRRGLPSTEHH